MNILKGIKSIIRNSTPKPSATVCVQPDIETYRASRLRVVEENAGKLKKRYRGDFISFMYRPELDKILKVDTLPFLAYPGCYNGFLNNDHWAVKHPFNFPGPFYTGESDTCATGDIEAPENVLYDAQCCEYIFRQPTNFTELTRVLDAAAVEVFDSYSCNGNNHWTYNLCKEWWRSKPDLIIQLNDPELKKTNGDSVQLYVDYLNSDAERDLKQYCFFLENNYYPVNSNINLPGL